MIRTMAHSVKKRFAHIKGCAIEYKSVGLTLSDQFADGDGTARQRRHSPRRAEKN